MQEQIDARFSENFKQVRREYNVQLARLSAPTGWNFRGRIREEQSDVYWAQRQLQWERFCIEMRDALLTTLQSVFSIIGRLRNEQPILEWTDLPTTKQVDESLRRLLEGGRFDEILKPFL
jgi:hypothetical protein